MAKRSNGSSHNGAGKNGSGISRPDPTRPPARGEAPRPTAGNIHVLRPATARTGGWDLRNLFADWPRRLILLGCMFGIWAMLLDTWTEDASGARVVHGFWVFLPFGKALAGETAFAAGKWLVPSAGMAWCLYCGGIGPRTAPPWARTWPLAAVIAMVLWQLVDYFDTAQQLRGVTGEVPAGMLRFAMTQAITGFGAWLLSRSQATIGATRGPLS